MQTDLGVHADDLPATVLPWLERDPVRHNLPGTIAAGACAGRSELHWVLARGTDGDVLGVGVCTPPRPLALSTMAPDVAVALAERAAGGGLVLTGVNGPAEPVDAFAARWGAPTGANPASRTELNLYRLDAVTPPSGVPGTPRTAGAADRDLVLAWAGAFVGEVHVGADAAPESLVDPRLDAGRLHLWEVDGHPVAMAGTAPRVSGVCRLGLVFTPPEVRGRGYAAALSAWVSGRELATGAVACMLYAESANATSNGVYGRIGYRLVAETAEVLFTP